MKRPLSPPTMSPSPPQEPLKKPKSTTTTTTTPTTTNHHDLDLGSNFSKLDDNLLYEVFKHADAKTLASASCVNKAWYRTALDERLWELICTRHWSSSSDTYSGSSQRRAVVLALGGFRLFYAKILYKTKAASSVPPPLVSASVPPRMVVRGGSKKDEINLTLSLLSIRYYYDKMNLANNKKV